VQSKLPWAGERCLLVAQEGEEHRFLGKARILNKHLANSVKTAVEMLNRGLIPCPDDCCIVFSVQFRTYHLLFRCNRHEALRLLRTMDDPVCNLKFRSHSSTTLPGTIVNKPLSVSTPTSRQPRIIFRRPDVRSTESLLHSSFSLPEVARCSLDSKASPVSHSTHAGLSTSSSQESLASSSTLPPTLPPTPRVRRTLVFPSWHPSDTASGLPEVVAASVGHAVDGQHDLRPEVSVTTAEQARRNVAEHNGCMDASVLENQWWHEKKSVNQQQARSISGCFFFAALMKVMQQRA